jgi:hypothetical protein
VSDWSASAAAEDVADGGEQEADSTAGLLATLGASLPSDNPAAAAVESRSTEGGRPITRTNNL